MSWEAEYQRDHAEQSFSGPVVFNEEQRKKNLQLKGLVRDLLPIDDDNKTTDCDLLYRFLIGRHWEVKSAEQMLRQYVTLRKAQKLNGILAEEVPPEVKAVMSPIYGVDKDGLPNLWMTPDPAKLLPVLKSRPKEDLLRGQMHVMEEARFISRSRGVDRCTYVLDMGKITMSSVNTLTLGFLRELIKILQEYYPEIMRRLLIFNTGWAITGAWKVLKPFVDARVQDKIRFSNGPPSVKTLLEFMTPENVLPEYGGTGKGSVLDEAIEAEVARLRAVAANPPKMVSSSVETAPQHPLTGTAPLPSRQPTKQPLISPLAVPSTATAPGKEAVHTPKRESPRSTEIPEELPLEQATDNPSQLFSLYTSFGTSETMGTVPYPHITHVSATAGGIDSPSRHGYSGSAHELSEGPATLRSFKSARSYEDDTDSSASTPEQVLTVADRDMVAQLSGFYGVGDGYLREGGFTADGASESSESGLAEALDDESRAANECYVPPPLLRESTKKAVAAGRVPTPPTTPPNTAAPLRTAATGGHVDPAAAVSGSPSGSTRAAVPTTAVTTVELSLVQSADGATVGYRGHQRVGQFRGSIIYGNPLCLLKPPNPVQQARGRSPSSKPLPLGDNDDQDLGSGTAPELQVLSTSFTPVARRVCPFPVLDQDDDEWGNLPPTPEDDDTHDYVVGELLRESGHPIHNYVIACDARRKARFVIRNSRLRSRVSVYQVVGDATVTTDGKVRHAIAGQKVKMGTTVPHTSPNARRDPGAWMMYGEDVTRHRKGIASSLWPFGRSASSNTEKAEAAANAGTENALLAECLGQTVKFYGVLARSHPVDLFALAMAISQLWLEGEPPTSGSGLRGLASSHHRSNSDESLTTETDKGENSMSGISGLLGSSSRFGDRLREVGSKLIKSSDTKAAGTSKQPR